MENYMMVILFIMNQKEMNLIYINMVILIKVNGKMVKSMVMEKYTLKILGNYYMKAILLTIN